MKTNSTRLFLLTTLVLISGLALAQQDWPKTINGPDGLVIKIYQPEPESYSANILKFRSAISVVESGQSEPVFGTFWATCKLAPEGSSRYAPMESVNVTSMKIPAITDQHELDYLKSTLEYQLPSVATEVSLNEVESALHRNQEESRLASGIATQAPRIIYTTEPSMLVTIDGSPRLQKNPDWGLDMVVNSPFTIIRNEDNQYYLYGGHHWFVAPAATGPFQYTYSVPANLYNIQNSIDKNNNSNNADGGQASADSPVPAIIVTTVPAELIQSKGEPNFAPISGTSLLYVANSQNDIFMDLGSQLYYVLISGRWYRSKSLDAKQWAFVPSDQLPGDFAKIPEGSAKDNVLASVAGTPEAAEALQNAQVPKTARIDRQTAHTQVGYQGDAVFAPIKGTNLEYAVNTSSTVLRYKGLYYTVDNGVWFVSGNPDGPWAVASERPDDVDLIPPSNPAYNSKYVYVYDADADYVYTGYTPGYLGSYVYGPTLVYGTGYYYNPWWGGYYYPRPWSWGFGFSFNPWYGWGFGLSFGWGGWFNFGYGYPGYYPGGAYCGGWWGPYAYHPPYCGYYGGYHPYGGYYGQNGTINRTNYYSSVYTRNSTNTLYQGRNGVSASGSRNYFGYANGQSGRFDRSNNAWANQQRSSQSANFSRSGYGSNGSQNNFYRSGTQSGYNRNYSGNGFPARQGSNSIQQRGQNMMQRDSRAYFGNPGQGSNMTRSYGRSTFSGFQRGQGYSAPAGSFGGSRSASPRSFAPASGGGRSFGGGSFNSGGGRSFSSGGGGGRSFSGGGGGGGGRAGRR